jgi:hypothetical protein
MYKRNGWRVCSFSPVSLCLLIIPFSDPCQSKKKKKKEAGTYVHSPSPFMSANYSFPQTRASPKKGSKKTKRPGAARRFRPSFRSIHRSPSAVLAVGVSFFVFEPRVCHVSAAYISGLRASYFAITVTSGISGKIRISGCPGLFSVGLLTTGGCTRVTASAAAMRRMYGVGCGWKVTRGGLTNGPWESRSRGEGPTQYRRPRMITRRPEEFIVLRGRGEQSRRKVTAVS